MITTREHLNQTICRAQTSHPATSIRGRFSRFFLGRPPFLPFSLAALAFASEVEAPPFAPPFVPQFRNISSTAFGSKSLIDLLDFFFVTSAILAR